MNQLLAYSGTSSEDEEILNEYCPSLLPPGAESKKGTPKQIQTSTLNSPSVVTVLSKPAGNFVNSTLIYKTSKNSDSEHQHTPAKSNRLFHKIDNNGGFIKDLPITDESETDEYSRQPPNNLASITSTISPGHISSSSDSQSSQKSRVEDSTVSRVASHDHCVALTPAPDKAPCLHLSELSDDLDASDSLLSSDSRKRKHCDNQSSSQQLGVPDSIYSMFHRRQPQWVDEPGQHDNRVRSFPHLEGNWATHVYVPVERSEPLVSFVTDLLEMLKPATFKTLPDFHVSLSRTVTIRHHWIEPLVESLRENLWNLPSCLSDFTAVKLFTNDDKTRTFVSIELSQDDQEFLDYVTAVDKSFAEFKLPAYYQDPSFHVSVGWCLGEVSVSEELLSRAQEMLSEFTASNPDLSFVFARQICCQSGCKSFVISLQDSDNIKT